jgi:hypothetical protein
LSANNNWFAHGIHRDYRHPPLPARYVKTSNSAISQLFGLAYYKSDFMKTSSETCFIHLPRRCYNYSAGRI